MRTADVFSIALIRWVAFFLTNPCTLINHPNVNFLIASTNRNLWRMFEVLCPSSVKRTFFKICLRAYKITIISFCAFDCKTVVTDIELISLHIFLFLTKCQMHF